VLGQEKERRKTSDGWIPEAKKQESLRTSIQHPLFMGNIIGNKRKLK